MAITKKSKTAEEAVKPKAVATGGAGKKPSWMMAGKKAAHAFDEEEKKAEQKKAESSKLFRFFLKPGEGAEITFVDGDLDDDGVLMAPIYREHRLHINGSWNNHFVCTSDEELCPICEGGDEPSLVATFTVIVHTPYKGKNKVYKDVKKLLIAKRNTYKMLQKIATKRGGLAGCTFDVSREGDKDAAVGGLFDFSEKHTLEELAAHYKDADFTPANYEEELPYVSAKELREQGFGGPGTPSNAAFEDEPAAGGVSDDDL